MIIIKNVQGTQITVPEIEINVDTVYLRTNIHKIQNEEGDYLWEYDEQQLTIPEYLKIIVPQNQEISDNAIAELLTLFSSYQQQVDSAIADLSTLLTQGGV